MAVSRNQLIRKIDFHYYQLGGKGELIILLHGWGASKEKFLPLGKALSKRGWRIFIPDLPGFGKSSQPAKPWSVGDYADFICEAIDQLFKGKKIFIFGHSFGGRMAIKVANSCPEEVAGIILCGSAGISRGSFLKRTIFMILAKMGKFVFPQNNRYRCLLYKLAREHDYEKTKGVMRETFKLVINENLRPLLSKIKIPTLICWGTKDRATKFTDAVIINSIIEGSQLVSFPGLGHRLPYSEPELLAEEITRWKENQ